MKPLRTKITTALGMPSNRISFGGQKRRASENRPNRKQDEIESKEYCHEKQRIRATVLCAILTNKPEYGKSYRNRRPGPDHRGLPNMVMCLFILVRFLSYGVEYLQMWALVRRLSGGIAPWCVGVGDSRACCALFGGVLRVGTYSRWGRG